MCPACRSPICASPPRRPAAPPRHVLDVTGRNATLEALARQARLMEQETAGGFAPAAAPTASVENAHADQEQLPDEPAWRALHLANERRRVAQRNAEVARARWRARERARAAVAADPSAAAAEGGSYRQPPAAARPAVVAPPASEALEERLALPMSLQLGRDTLAQAASGDLRAQASLEQAAGEQREDGTGEARAYLQRAAVAAETTEAGTTATETETMAARYRRWDVFRDSDSDSDNPPADRVRALLARVGGSYQPAVGGGVVESDDDD